MLIRSGRKITNWLAITVFKFMKMKEIKGYENIENLRKVEMLKLTKSVEKCLKWRNNINVSHSMIIILFEL